MKHFYITVFIFVSIIGFCQFSDKYVNKTVEIFENKIETAENYEDYNEMKDLFQSKKNMLRLFLNKEHIDYIELRLSLLENRYYCNNKYETEKISIEILNGLDDIRHEITDFL